MSRASIGIMTAQMQTTYDDLLRVWLEADELPGIEHAWLFDHLMPIGGDPLGPALDGWTTLSALAARTRRLRLGLLVTSNRFRPPAVLAKIATTVDVVSGGRLDLGIGVGSRPDHPLARFRHIRRADLTAHRFLVREAGSGTRMVHEHYFLSEGLALPQAQEMDSNANIKQAVMANMGLAFISAHTIALELEAGKLTILDAEGMPEWRDWFVLYPKDAKLGAAGRRFRDHIRAKGPAFMQDFFGDALALDQS